MTEKEMVERLNRLAENLEAMVAELAERKATEARATLRLVADEEADDA